jgi:hypothetical protein
MYGSNESRSEDNPHPENLIFLQQATQQLRINALVSIRVENCLDRTGANIRSTMVVKNLGLMKIRRRPRYIMFLNFDLDRWMLGSNPNQPDIENSRALLADS